MHVSIVSICYQNVGKNNSSKFEISQILYFSKCLANVGQCFVKLWPSCSKFRQMFDKLHTYLVHTKKKKRMVHTCVLIFSSVHMVNVLIPYCSVLIYIFFEKIKKEIERNIMFTCEPVVGYGGPRVYTSLLFLSRAPAIFSCSDEGSPASDKIWPHTTPKNNGTWSVAVWLP